MTSPSQQLAEKIVTRLIEEGLLSSARGKRLQGKLADGTLKEEDWKVEIELSQQEVSTEVSK